MKATSQQIADEILALVELIPKVPRSTAFGENNHAAISAQVEALQEGRDLEDLDELLESGDLDENSFDAARYAIKWRDDVDAADDGSPSSGWEALAK